MKILQIHPFIKSEALSPSTGGMARLALTLTRALEEGGHDVRILPYPEKTGRRYSWNVVSGRSTGVLPALIAPGTRDWLRMPAAFGRLRPPADGLQSGLYDAMAIAALRKALAAFRPEIVHNHVANELFPRLARALGNTPPLILTHHHHVAARGLEVYSRVLFASQAAMDARLSECGYPRERSRVVYYPVRSAFREGAVAPDETRSGVYFVGTLYRRKGIDLLLEAYRREKRLWREPVHICGTGEDLPLVEQAIREGLPVIWEGPLAQDAVAERLRTARLVVIPSRLEGFCVALAEGFCCGVPAVGWAPTVRELEARFAFAPGVPFDGSRQGPEELARDILALLESDLCRTESRITLAEKARGMFSEAAFRETNLAVYAEVLAEAGKQPA